MTSLLQPMNQGVIRSLKVHYGRKILRLCIQALYKNMPLPKITILEAMKIFSSSWSELFARAIVNCFRKAETRNSSQTIRAI